jgi:hypothetical protein
MNGPTQPEPSMDPIPGPEVYAAVAARRNQIDSLLWQVPALSVTGQAFLFSAALAPDARFVTRLLACLLSLTLTVLTLQLFARHRQGELTDAHWLEEYEKAKYGQGHAHGRTWQRRRDATHADASWISNLGKIGSFKVWSAGLAIFGVAAIGVLVIALAWPTVLQ